MARRTPRKARPLLLADDAARGRLLDAIRGGSPLVQAAVYAGISERTLFRTLARGEEADQALDQARQDDPSAQLAASDETCRQLWLEVKGARAGVAVRNVALIQKAAQGGYVVEETTKTYVDDNGRQVTERSRKLAPVDWKAGAWLLDKSFPKDFGRGAQQLEIINGSVPGGAGAPGDEPSETGMAAIAARVAHFAAQSEQDTGEVYDAELVDEDVLADEAS